MRPQGAGTDDPAAEGRWVLHHPDPAGGCHPDPTAGLPEPLRARRDRLPGPETTAGPAALPRVLPGPVEGGQRLRAARARLPAARAAPGNRGAPRLSLIH